MIQISRKKLHWSILNLGIKFDASSGRINQGNLTEVSKGFSYYQPLNNY